MGYPKRTAFCEKCGSVGFKIRQGVGFTDYVCSECYTHLATIKCNDYETLKPVCNKCNGDIFKIKIQENEEKEKWSVGCINCKEAPALTYVDDGCKEIDRITKELLGIKKTINKFEDEIKLISEVVKNIEDDVADIDNRIRNSMEEVDNINSVVNGLKKLVDKQRIKTIALDEDVAKVRNRLSNITNY